MVEDRGDTLRVSPEFDVWTDIPRAQALALHKQLTAALFCAQCESGCRAGWVHLAAHSEPCNGCNSDESRPYPKHGHPGYDLSAGRIERAVWTSGAMGSIANAFRSALIDRAREICHETGTADGTDAFCADTIRQWLDDDVPAPAFAALADDLCPNPACDNGVVDSGGIQPWGEPITERCPHPSHIAGCNAEVADG